MAKHPPLPRAGTPAAASASPSSAPTHAELSAPLPASPTAPAAEPVPAFAEKTEALRNDDMELRLTNRGGGISEIVLAHHLAENGAHVVINGPDQLPIGAILDHPEQRALPEFTSARGADGSVTFERKVPEALTVTNKFSIPPPDQPRDNYVTRLEITFRNDAPASVSRAPYYIALGSAAPIHPRDLPSYTRVTWCNSEGKVKSTDTTWFAAQNYPLVGVQKRAAQEFFNEQLTGAEWVGVSSQFFATLVTPLNAKAIGVWARRFDIARADQPAPLHGIEGAMEMPGFELKPGEASTVQLQIYSGPKLYHRLAQLGHDEAEIMNFGTWKLVSQFLLNFMNLLHRYLGSYAAAIVLLTVAIKAVLWPLQNKANRSMRQMSSLAPKMNELKEKYKDDPTKMNAEVMKLYKEYGVNPVSGCLPMAIQIPIFFGLLSMLGQAVELRNTHFLWVRDLSQPDTVAHLPGLGWPVNILPLLMAATNLWLMRMTPKSGDTTQQRMLMFMPLIFLFFCYNFAAALALYYTTLNLLTVLQLYQNRNLPAPALAKVTPPGKKRRGGR